MTRRCKYPIGTKIELTRYPYGRAPISYKGKIIEFEYRDSIYNGWAIFEADGNVDSEYLHTADDPNITRSCRYWITDEFFLREVDGATCKLIENIECVGLEDLI